MSTVCRDRLMNGECLSGSPCPPHPTQFSETQCLHWYIEDTKVEDNKWLWLRGAACRRCVFMFSFHLVTEDDSL